MMVLVWIVWDGLVGGAQKEQTEKTERHNGADICIWLDNDAGILVHLLVSFFFCWMIKRYMVAWLLYDGELERALGK